ncbi:SDR family oxidoreductase [Chengkuizengella sediminis]|uniref:SDR family oxidoreductase n=1 Tax=Chengkuizengella sediminis TaxID=1885917 RepID=UPI0013896D88|nr:SDR family oxidoreductase [Chengkuizengella sediminis]NDI33979.1 SDR family oxidoreductase [Chengkuizengella sediminis]
MYPQYPYYGYKKEIRRVPITFPPQHQNVHPGLEFLMVPRPISEDPNYRSGYKLHNKVAIITGGDSGIGRAIAIAFAKEGADITIVYLNEHRDAAETKHRVEKLGRKCLAISADLRKEETSKLVIKQTIDTFEKLDILINNAGDVYASNSILDISSEQLEHTFRTNIFSMFYMAKAALPYLKNGSSIINTASIVAFQGGKNSIDYSASKGAVVAFTRSLSSSLVQQGIRVNSVAPGPIWTPLIPSAFSAEQVTEYGLSSPMNRAGQPFELAPAYVYLASDDSRYVTGQSIHVNGGNILNT